MNDLLRVELRDLSTKSLSSPAHAGRTAVILLLAGLIVTAMVVWVGFLGWGVITILESLAHRIGAFF
jgi:hypothetical protein